MLTRFFRQRRGEEGFTLIELLVVVAIIALLTAFAVPSLYQAMNKSKSGKDKVALDTISGAVERYYVDHTSYPTDSTKFKDQSADYVKKSFKWANSFSRQYVYITDEDGTFYIVADPTTQASITINCGSTWPANGEITKTGSPAALPGRTFAVTTPVATDTTVMQWTTIQKETGGTSTLAAPLPSNQRKDCKAVKGKEGDATGLIYVEDTTIPVFTSF